MCTSLDPFGSCILFVLLKILLDRAASPVDQITPSSCPQFKICKQIFSTNFTLINCVVLVSDLLDLALLTLAQLGQDITSEFFETIRAESFDQVVLF